MRLRASGGIALSAVLLLAACDEKGPTSPALHSITGHVKLTGYLINANGDFAGTRVVGDADGMLVELSYGEQVVARTTTVDGIYTFHGIGPGGYFAQTAKIGPLFDRTQPLTVARSDLFVADTLRLAPQGGHLYPVPNPVGGFTLIYFYLEDSARVNVSVLELDGNPVRHVVRDYDMPPDLQYAGWDGYDDQNRPTPAGLYWLLFQAGGDQRIQLLFR